MASGKAILVVDTDENARDFCRVVLEPRGYRVVWAAGPSEGRRLAQSEPPDLVVLFIGVDGEDSGVGTAQWLARELPHVPVVIVSPRDGVGTEVVDMSRAPAAVRLSSPLTHRALIENVRALTGPQPPGAY